MKTINLRCASMLLLMATAARAVDPRDNLVIHDKEGNFNGQVESAPDGSKKFVDCHGNFAGQTTSSGTFDAHGNRVGSVFDLQQMSDCRKTR
jgi:hypothetical protein